jgi:hypothetical protein
MDTNEARQLMQLAIGRILRLGSRPFQEGDIEQSEMARAAFYRAIDALGIKPARDLRPNWVRDRLLGAQGDA